MFQAKNVFRHAGQQNADEVPRPAGAEVHNDENPERRLFEDGQEILYILLGQRLWMRDS